MRLQPGTIMSDTDDRELSEAVLNSEPPAAAEGAEEEEKPSRLPWR